MDGDRFDHWARERARRLSRRQAMSAAGTAGLAAAITRVLPTSAQPNGPTCQMAIQALTSAGPSTGIAYSGLLAIALSDDGSIDSGSFTPDGGQAVDVVGESSGRALSLRITFPSGEALVLTGTGEKDIETCSGALSGVFGGPELGDTGSWLIDPTRSQRTESELSGSCALVCDDPFVLDATTCQCLCPAPNEICGDACLPPCDTNAQLDPNTCSCTPVCDLGCPDGQTLDVDACTCVDFCSDPAHPFYCGGQCYGHEQTICLGGCHDLLLHDPTQCGPDCAICPNGVPCLDGVCECPDGYTYCEVVGCKDLSSDNDNCGTCGMICLGSEVCFEGGCALV